MSDEVSRTGRPADVSGPMDGVGSTAGVAAAVDQAGPLLPLRDVEQLALPIGDRVKAETVAQAPRGRGRPAGAKNRRSGEIRDYLLSRYAHPLEVLAQTYSRPVEVLAAELGCKLVEAKALQVRSAVELAPYIEGKMPVSIDLRSQSDIVLVMTAPGAAAATAEAIRAEGIDAIDWSQADVEPVPAEMADFREISDDHEGQSE